MDLPPYSPPDLASAYLAQVDLPHSEQYDVVSTQQLYPPYGVDETYAFDWPMQDVGGSVVVAQDHALQPSNSPTLHPSHARYDVELFGNGQSTSSAVVTGPTSPMAPPARQRKRKAATLRADDWEPYKERILDLHIEQKKPLPEVRQILEQEYGFKAEPRQYRLRISQWGMDKNVKPQEMQAIVRKRQRRKLVETGKGELAFEVRGSEVELQKIERWMKRHDVVDSALYAPSPAAPTPSDVGCHTISERGSPAMTSFSVFSPVASVLSPGVLGLTRLSPQMSSPALTMSGLERNQVSAFTGQSSFLLNSSFPNTQVSFDGSLTAVGRATDVGTRTRYNQDEEQSLRYEILVAENSSTGSIAAMSDLLYKLGSVLLAQGRYTAAEVVLRKLVEVHEQRSGGSDDNTDALKALDLLGLVLLNQGLYAEAERLFRRALRGREMVLTIEHPNTLETMCNLTQSLVNQGKFREAEEENTRSRALCMRVLGPLNTITLMSVCISARVLHELGRYEEAASSYIEAIALQERVLGPEHSDTLTSMSNLARVLSMLGRCEEAEVQAKKALGLNMKLFGSEHPATLTSQHTLASVLGDEGKYKDAEVMWRGTLSCRQKVLGPEHPDTLLNIVNLARSLHSQGRGVEAEAMVREATSLFKKALGPEHPHTLFAERNLADILFSQSRYDEAEAMHREKLALGKKVLGPKHPDNLISVERLQEILMIQGKFGEVFSLE